MSNPSQPSIVPSHHPPSTLPQPPEPRSDSKLNNPDSSDPFKALEVWRPRPLEVERHRSLIDQWTDSEQHWVSNDQNSSNVTSNLQTSSDSYAEILKEWQTEYDMLNEQSAEERAKDRGAQCVYERFVESLKASKDLLAFPGPTPPPKSNFGRGR